MVSGRRPVPAEIERFVDTFEALAWAGTRPEPLRAWSVVVHRDHEGGVHAHILAARCDLASRAEPEHRPAGVAEDVRPAARRLHYEHGWSRPDDPARARAYRDVSQMLSGRARARALAAERPEPSAAPGLVARLFTWLLERMERLLERPHPSSAARQEDGSRGADAGRVRAAVAEGERAERDLAGQLIAAARTAARQ